MTEQSLPIAENLDPYDGKWVALRNGKVVAHADDESSLRAQPAISPEDLVVPIGHPVTGFYMLNV